MNKKLIYFLRNDESFKEFNNYYNINNNNCKNEPLFNYELNSLNFDLLNSSNIFLITSKLAFKALLTTNQFSNVPLILVGRNLAQYVQSNNFSNIIYIGNNIAEIITYLKNYKTQYQSQKILYLRGNYIKTNIKNILTEFNIKEELAYQVNYKNDFSREFIDNLKLNNIKIIIFFSFKNTERFIMICHKLSLISYLSDINSISLSPEVEIFKNYFKVFHWIESVDLIANMIKQIA